MSGEAGGGSCDGEDEKWNLEGAGGQDHCSQSKHILP